MAVNRRRADNVIAQKKRNKKKHNCQQNTAEKPTNYAIRTHHAKPDRRLNALFAQIKG
jgi:uncharacterized protein YecT (DUF1311 family)